MHSPKFVFALAVCAFIFVATNAQAPTQYAITVFLGPNCTNPGTQVFYPLNQCTSTSAQSVKLTVNGDIGSLCTWNVKDCAGTTTCVTIMNNQCFAGVTSYSWASSTSTGVTTSSATQLQLVAYNAPNCAGSVLYSLDQPFGSCIPTPGTDTSMYYSLLTANSANVCTYPTSSSCSTTTTNLQLCIVVTNGQCVSTSQNSIKYIWGSGGAGSTTKGSTSSTTKAASSSTTTGKSSSNSTNTNAATSSSSSSTTDATTTETSSSSILFASSAALLFLVALM